MAYQPKKRESSKPKENKNGNRTTRFSKDKSKGTKPGQRPSGFSENKSEENKSGNRPARFSGDKSKGTKPRQRSSKSSEDQPESRKPGSRPARFASDKSRERQSDEGPKRFSRDKSTRGESGGYPKRTFNDKSKGRFSKPSSDSDENESKGGSFKRKPGFGQGRLVNKFQKPYKSKSVPKITNADKGLTRLNKYIANAGVCSRREAENLIISGAVTVNGKVVTELGTTVSKSDVVHYGSVKIASEKPVYILLNKSKGYITTMDDPQKRKTVMHLIGDACKERVYPVGRLDRDTTGLLLLTNDGELTKKLTHPKHGVKKIYHVVLHKNFTKADLDRLVTGIELEDGLAVADVVSYVGDGSDKKEIGIEIHTGKNRVIRRMMEALGYKVVKLDRVFFAELSKKGIPRGKFRFLSEKEVAMLKRLG